MVNGTTGESPTTSDDEKSRLLEAVVEAVGGRAAVIAGAGTNNTAHSIELAQQAAKAGADGLARRHAVLQQAPPGRAHRPFPRRGGCDRVADDAVRHPRPHGGPTGARDPAAIWPSTPGFWPTRMRRRDPFAAACIMAECDLAYYSGDDGLNLPLLAVGAAGFVSVVSHVVGDRLASMHDAYRAGDVARAKELNDSVLPVITALMTHTQGAIATKAALDLLDLPGGGPVRPPLSAPTDHERELIASRADRSGAPRMSHAHLDLRRPDPIGPNALRIVALGGIGEIGRNMTVFEYAGDLLIVDCGVLFPIGDPARSGPDPARLLVPRGPLRRHRRGGADARARGPHRRAPVPASQARGHPGLRLPADPCLPRFQAARAPDQATSRSGSGTARW